MEKCALHDSGIGRQSPELMPTDINRVMGVDVAPSSELSTYLASGKSISLSPTPAIKATTMYSLKLELKLNNFERSFLAGSAGFSRLVYNFGLSLLTSSWGFLGVKASDSKRLTQIEKVFTNHVKTLPQYAWMKQYSSAIYSSHNLHPSAKSSLMAKRSRVE